jgi:hypothetical protein
MRRQFLFHLTFAMLIGLSTGATAQAPAAARHGADLGIGRGLNSHRPNILVAWRNTERILEVEILVRNLGDRVGRGTVRLEICDEEGKRLVATDPFPVSVPARADGGEDGTIVQTKGFRMMNIMFDQLDRLNQRYKLRATVQTEGGDINPVDNVATKSFNVDNRALAGSTSNYRYRLTNASDSVVHGSLVLDHSALPANWHLSAEPAIGTPVVLQPGEVFIGYLTVKTPPKVKDGDYVDLQASIVTPAKGVTVVMDQDEWFLVATSQPPLVDPPVVIARPDGSILVDVAAVDSLSGIKEASGAQVAYSLDHGTTFSTRVMAYSRGDFYTKTWFEATLGPFADGVEVKPVVTVSNNANIVRRFDLPPVMVRRPVTGATGREKARDTTAKPSKRSR